jgi:hypothetical protein
VQVADSGCANVSAILHISGLGVESISGAYGLQLFPNPNNGSFTLQFSDNREHYVWLTDMTGRMITEEAAVTGYKDFEISGLSCGVYLLQIHDASGLQTLRMVVQR